MSNIWPYRNDSPVTIKVRVDCSGGGTGETTAIETFPVGTIIHDVVAVVVTALDGDATTTLEVGVAANADKYIDTADYDETDDSTPDQASMLNGANNDQKTAEFCAAAVAMIATWTNTASATAGVIDVYVTYTATV